MAMAIDTGFRPQMVYDFAARHPQPAHGPAGDRVYAQRTVIPTKGTPDFLKLIARVSPRMRRASGRTCASGTSARTGRSRNSTIGCVSRCPTTAASRRAFSITRTRIRTSIAGCVRSRGSSGQTARSSGYRTSRSGTNRWICGAVRAAAAICGLDSFSEADWAALEGNAPTEAPRASRPLDAYWGAGDRGGTLGGKDWFK